MDEAEVAILIRGARKRYTAKGPFVLDDLDLTVCKGTIYGLLGASGCGKTTLLSSLVGRRELETQMISVLGSPPGQASVKSIGYMPQEVALMGEFTVKGVVQHFGWIFGMTDQQIDTRFDHLRTLLELPPSDRLVKHLSGGQQRRVSLAVVLIHDPELLILDEPTVGIDPILRQNIWDYFVEIAEKEKKTIIITTHYIEEANQAHKIGLMRHGKILAEGKPETLISKYNGSTIEDIFVLLSREQDETRESKDFEGMREVETEEPFRVTSRVTQPKTTLWDRIWFTNKGHAKALLTKNFIRFKNHPGTILFAFFFPVLQMLTFLIAIGTPPSDFQIGIVNEELGNYTDCIEFAANAFIGGRSREDRNKSCMYSGLSCQFVNVLGGDIKNKVYFSSKEEALDALKRGKIHNFVHLPYNLSDTVSIIRDENEEFDDVDLENQQISIYTDYMDPTLGVIVNKEVLRAYRKYSEKLASDCSINPHVESIPIKFNDPVYGSFDLTYRDYITPGMLGLIAIFLAISISTAVITSERTEGIWERTRVAGVTSTEILLCHGLTLSCMSIVQIIEVFVLAFYIFNLECRGNLVTVFILIYIQSVVGVSFGILISVVTRNVTEANYASVGLFYPLMILTGCVWPLEGMPTYLRYFSYFVPSTILNKGLVSVMYKGWGFEHAQVMEAAFASLGFIVIFIGLSALILRREKNK